MQYERTIKTLEKAGYSIKRMLSIHQIEYGFQARLLGVPAILEAEKWNIVIFRLAFIHNRDALYRTGCSRNAPRGIECRTLKRAMEMMREATVTPLHLCQTATH